MADDDPLFPYSHPMNTTPAEDEDIAIAGDDFVGLEEDVEIKAAMATLNNAATNAADPGSPSVASAGAEHHRGSVDVGPYRSFHFSGATVGARQAHGTDGCHDAQRQQHSSSRDELKRSSSMTTAENSGVEKSSDDEIPVAVPVSEGEDAGAAVVATVVDEGEGAVETDQKVGGADGEKIARANSDVSSAGGHAKKAKRKHGKKSEAAPASSSGASRGGGVVASLSRGTKGGYQGSYRTAAAAHRNRQIHVPPIGSPGLLMLPTAASTAVLPNADDGDDDDEAKKKRWLFRNEYLLPSTVFRHSMAAGGYTLERRREVPHRGSATEREVGDMFDSDAGGLYLHFPELIPEDLWERRLGDKSNVEEEGDDDGEGVKKEADGKIVKKEGNDGPASSENKKGGGVIGSSNSKKKEGPKGARSSYIFFTNSQRPKMVVEFPGMRFTEQGVIMGERWRALTPEEKKPFEELANKDKERYSREMKEYIESVKKEIRDEKLQKGKKEEEEERKDGQGDVKRESKGDGDGDGDDNTKGSAKAKEGTPPRENEIKGPRLVDAVILSLSKMLGEKVHRKEAPTEPPGFVSSSSTIKPEPVSSDSTTNDVVDPPPHVTPDLTLDELPRFNDYPRPRTRKRPRPHSPLSFLDMIPVSLTAAYPPSYVERRRAYAKAVRACEDAIVDAQEAKDDADDAQEKYMAHTEAWERMLEYQKGQIAKREMERKRRKREKEEREQTEAAEREGKGGEGIDGAAPDSADDVVESAEGSAGGGGDGKKAEATPPKDVEEKKVERAPSPPPEDPMECMPPRPQPPGPARVVTIPDIPTPPSPPSVIEMENDNGYDDSDGKDGNNNPKADVDKMFVPKLNTSLLDHLDPSCFLPTLSSGRYFGLLSNGIADPQFCGPLAPGIAGMTYGGGTGLATSYAGGGRGAVGLVSGPLRGGNLWQTPAGVGVGGGGGSSKGDGGSGSKAGERRLATKEKTPDEAKSSKSSAGAPVVGSPSSAPSCDRKRPASVAASEAASKAGSTPASSEKKKKKQKRTLLGLATGDRNTSATEIASGSAGSEFPEGWIIKTYRRSGGETVGKTDRFWFSPGRYIRFRAKKHAKNFVDILNEPNVNGDEDKAAEIYRARGLHF